MCDFVARTRIVITATVIWSVLIVSASHAQDIPVSNFESYSELEQWVSSAFGGGTLERLGETNYFSANRMHTSGIQSSEVAIYLREGDSFRLMLYLLVKMMVHRKVRLKNDAIVITEVGDGPNGDQIIVPIRLLNDT